MIELTKTRRLTIAVVAFILLIIIGFLTLRNPKYIYSISTQEMLDELKKGNGQTDIKELEEILTSGDNSVVSVDLRNPYEFEKNGLVNAVNIPVSEIMTDESISFFEDMQSELKEVIIYGENHLVSNSIWMILRQLGFDNINVILHDYSVLQDQNVKIINLSQNAENKLETPITDFAEYINNNAGISIENSGQKEYTKQIIPTRRKKKAATAGGC